MYISVQDEYYHVGTYPYKVQAEHFYQKALKRENVLNVASAERQTYGKSLKQGDRLFGGSA